MVDVEDMFASWEDDELDHLEQRVNLVEDQIDLNVDLFSDVALNVREQLVAGKMDLADVNEYIKTEMERPLKDFESFEHHPHLRPDIEEITPGDLPVLDQLNITGLPEPPAEGATFWENDPERGELGRL